MSTEHLTIQQLAAEDRPREKAIAQGLETLSNSELVAILLGSGTKTQSAIEVARSLLKKFDDSIDKLGRATLKDLQESKGIGAARAVVVMAALELGRRRAKHEANVTTPSISSSADAYQHLRPMMADLTSEVVYAMMLGPTNKIIQLRKVLTGTDTHVLFDVRSIVELAINAHATKVIVAHNHPSGSNRPSQADMEVTRRLREALRIFDISLADHLIVCAHSFYSFADEALL